MLLLPQLWENKSNALLRTTTNKGAILGTSRWIVVISIIFFLRPGLYAGPNYIIHTIKSGETLWSISRKYRISYAKLISHNPKINPKKFSAGTKIRIPKYQRNTIVNHKSTYQVKNGDTLWSIAGKFSISPGQLARNNNLSINHQLKAGKILRIPGKNSYIRQATFQGSNNVDSNNHDYENQNNNSGGYFSWPVKGTLIENYGKTNHIFNGGVKIRSYQRQIFAAKKGRVIFVGVIRGYGFTIMINHGRGLVSVCSAKRIRPMVQVGTYIKTGRVIAVRQRGCANITLFFQVWKNNRVKNPINYLK